MNNNHRYFIQYMLKNGVVTVDNAQKYCQYITKGEIETITELKTLVLEINREISKQYYTVTFNICEVTNENYLIWLNTRNDVISKLQITYSAIELEYFHCILQEILRSEDHRITFIVCINITSILTSFFSRENGQKVLTKWLKNGYFISKNSYIYLGPRLILEFTSYLKTHLPTSICSLCSELVFWGQVCDSCHRTVHSYCLKKYLENQNNCPSCLEIWTAPILDVENNETHMDTDQPEDRSISRVISSNSVGLENFSEDEDSAEEDPNVPGPSTRRRHR